MLPLPLPIWNDYKARQLYYELFNKPDEELSEEEKEFVKTMYHMEEFACGLDG